MVLAGEWSEELLAEYLEIAGYFVKTNYPVQILQSRGGRGEIDILGIKVENNQLIIFQIEVGYLPQELDKAYNNIVNKKFGSAVAKEIQKMAKDFGFSRNYVWRKWYVDPGTFKKSQQAKKWNNLKNKLRNQDIELKTLEEVLNEIKAEIGRWKQRHKTPQGYPPTIPENLWILKAFEGIKIV